MKRFAQELSTFFALAVSAVPHGAHAVTIDMVTVGNPGNAPDTRYDATGYGAVGYVYQIGKYEVTARQYTEFLNAVAKDDPNELYNTAMGNSGDSNIQQAGSSPNFNYSVASDWAERPVNWVSFWDAARFANWLHNGQPTGSQGAGTTEDGAYHDVGNQALFGRNAGARFFIPTEDEWYKAAYHDKSAGLTASYFDYPTGTNEFPGNDINETTNPGNNANYDFAIGSSYYITVAGEFELSDSPYGTFDQCGNVMEWNETAEESESRGWRGGSFVDSFGSAVLQAGTRFDVLPTGELSYVGFRVASIDLPGDFNHDGTVDAADYVVWRKTGGSQEGYNTWRANFGQTFFTGTGAGATGSAIASTDAQAPAIPEPSTLPLTALSVFTWILIRRTRSRCTNSLLVALALSVMLQQAHATTINTVPIGNPGNLADTRYIDSDHPDGVGAVAYPFRIGQTEITNAQYVDFLNAVAKSDPYGLFTTNMSIQPQGGILRSSASGNFTYRVKDPAFNNDNETYTYDNKPVVYVSSGDAMRFANWLHNHQPNGDEDASTTEDGAYFLNGATSNTALANVTRKAGARWWLPNEAEWYKAAYHKNDGVTDNYWDYPTGTNDVPNNNSPSSDTGNSANHWYTTGDTRYPLTDVGAYTLSRSSYGTFDQGGNVWDWNETLFDGVVLGHGMRGGSWQSNCCGGSSFHLGASFWFYRSPTSEGNNTGFRVATIPDLPGDFNHDGAVDAADYVVWRKTGGSPDDYNAWQTNFARTLFTDSAAGAISSAFPLPPSPLDAAIPEPSSATLLALILPFAWRIRSLRSGGSPTAGSPTLLRD